MASNNSPILVTGAAGSIGSVGRAIVEFLCDQDLPVRALVHRLDERSEALSDMGAEVVVADLTSGADVARAMNGCRRVYFGMSVSPSYLQATVIAAAVAREIADFEVLVNISQMTVSQMTLTNMTDSKQQQQHWLGEEVLNWSGVPVVHVQSTVFLEHPFFSILAPKTIAANGTIRLPFGTARTSPIAASDVARVISTILSNPAPHIAKIYEITGPRSVDMYAIAKEYEEALERSVQYINVPFDKWVEEELRPIGLPEHVFNHLVTMAQLHADNRYDRFTDDVQKITGEPSMSVRDYVASHPEVFRK